MENRRRWSRVTTFFWEVSAKLNGYWEFPNVRLMRVWQQIAIFSFKTSVYSLYNIIIEFLLCFPLTDTARQFKHLTPEASFFGGSYQYAKFSHRSAHHLPPYRFSRNSSSVIPAVLIKLFNRSLFKMPCGIERFHLPNFTILWLPLPCFSIPPKRTKALIASSCRTFDNDGTLCVSSSCCQGYWYLFTMLILDLTSR